MEKINVEKAIQRINEIKACQDRYTALTLEYELYHDFICDLADEKYYTKEEIAAVAKEITKAKSCICR